MFVFMDYAFWKRLKYLYIYKLPDEKHVFVIHVCCWFDIPAMYGNHNNERNKQNWWIEIETEIEWYREGWHDMTEKQRQEHKRAMTRTYCAIHLEFSSWEMYNEIIGKPEPWLSSVYLHQNKNARHLLRNVYYYPLFFFLHWCTR